jgi:hypothetical protein
MTYIKEFWTFVKNLPLEQKKKFLSFTTGKNIIIYLQVLIEFR